MPHINVLDKNTIDKIAAGEVIERPASVVKELLENAIDAKATAVTVEIRDGGISFIRVTDNGCGIPKEEIALAFLRHSTSKIKSAEDLFTVSSLGFRGEALSSIAAVSQVEIITKTANSLTGTRYQIEGGTEKSLEEVGAPEGTTFIARNLFFNTPVRRKFLKTPQTEGAHVADLVEKIALSHPEVSIRFIQNNQNKLHTSGNHNLKDIIYTVFGRDIASNLLPVKAQNDDVSITGFIGKPVIARSNRNYENYFINGRYIKSSIVARAIEEAYKPFMMQHKYPFTMLHFSIEPEFLDVNVHPSKMELRFRDGEGIYNLILTALQAALAEKELIPEVDLEKKERAETKKAMDAMEKKELERPEPFEKKRISFLQEHPAREWKTPAPQQQAPSQPLVREESAPYGHSLREKPASYGYPQGHSIQEPVSPAHPAAAVKEPERPAPFSGGEDRPAAVQDSLQKEDGQQLDLFDGKLLQPESRKRHKLIGQLFDTYWLVQYADKLYIIDQHAAHEKVLYERLMKNLKERAFQQQILSPPIILNLSMQEEELFLRYRSCFAEMGFEIEEFGDRAYAVRAVPADLPGMVQNEILMEFLDSLSDITGNVSSESLMDRVATMSCKAAVKGNHRMSAAEAKALIDELLTLENPYNCPHGRPTIISMTKYELEKKFKRIV